MARDVTYSDTGVAKTNADEYSVSEVSAELKKLVEDRFGHVRIRGEISGFRGPHSSGHCYFSLKDEKARIEAVIWRGTVSRLKHLPEEGLEVVATGKLSTYPGSSKYQIVIDNLEPAGAGALMAILEKRKKQLEAEGLFDPARKQLLPYMPRTIGVVTSPTGAVIRDVLHRIKDRFPLHVIVWPVRVQGETTGSEVAAAVAGLNAADGSKFTKPDLIIVARGGGSIEDLWGFNDELLVRAVAASDVPVISAVGHETDWTLVDLAADVRAPTPTGAAEMAVPVRAELEAGIAQTAARLQSSLSRLLDSRRTLLTAAIRGLSTPDSLLALPRRRFDEADGRLGRALVSASRAKKASFDVVAGRLNLRGLSSRISTETGQADAIAARNRAAISSHLERASGRFAQASRLLDSLSHRSVLERGFALVRDSESQVISSVSGIAAGSRISVELSDGRLEAQTVSGKVSKPKPRKKQADGSQGSLF